LGGCNVVMTESTPPTRPAARSTSSLLAEEDVAFIRRDELRAVRLQLELAKPELILEDHHIRSTIVVFGSSRIPEPAAAATALARAKEALSRRPGDGELQRDVRVAERMVDKSRFYDEAREFARIVSMTCQVGGPCDYVVVTGGGPGVMEAANRGAHDVGAKTVGYNIHLPFEQAANPYITPELCFQFRYFAIRKMHFLLRARALLFFPGGFGTLDELFETLTLIQTAKVPPVPVILLGREFWERAIDFEFLVEEGVISPGDLDLFQFADGPMDAWNRIARFHKLAM